MAVEGKIRERRGGMLRGKQGKTEERGKKNERKEKGVEKTKTYLSQVDEGEQ